MILTPEIRKYIDKSVLCWLATTSKELIPNVSPKELFKHYKDDKIIIANVASPQTVRNIRQNEQICLSFIDILVQKGFQLKGRAKIITKKEDGFRDMEAILLKMTGGNFPFNSITLIEVESAKAILAPSYLFYPEQRRQNKLKMQKNRME